MESEALKRYKEKEALRHAINLKHLENGVEFVDLQAAYIDESVEIGPGPVIGPCVTLKGKTVIGENCIIGQNSRIEDSVIGDGVEVQSSVIVESRVGAETTVGPFAYLRPKSNIGAHCKIGDFVEVKYSNFGDGS